MGQRTRAMRRWGERVARWTLTLLLVALIGVTVASGWYELEWLRVFNGGSRTSISGSLLFVSRGGVSWSVRHEVVPPGVSFTPNEHVAIRRSPRAQSGAGPDAMQPLPPRPAFNFWHIDRDGSGWTLPLSYPTLAVALPAAFLWCRRLRRRRRRGACVECGYDLVGLVAGEKGIVCPECGAANAAGRVGGRAAVLKAKTP